MLAVGKAAFEHRWRRRDADEIRRMRDRLQETASVGDLKRGPGGIVDIEFLVQMLQLKHGRRSSEIREPNTIQALSALHAAEFLSEVDYEFFQSGYRLLRTIESRLRLMNSTARDQLPKEPGELNKLARLLHYESSEALLDDYEEATRGIRRRFDERMNDEG